MSLKNTLYRAQQAAIYMAKPIMPKKRDRQYLLQSIEALPPYLKENEIGNILLVCGTRKHDTMAYERLKSLLNSQNIGHTLYCKSTKETSHINVKEGTLYFYSGNCQAIVALGGGSVIDCAKMISAKVEKNNINMRASKNEDASDSAKPMVIAIPTTAGSGSEIKQTANLTELDRKSVHTITNYKLVPECAVLDHTLTTAMSKALTVEGGMDALTHAIEAYVSRFCSKETSENAEAAISLIFNNLERAYSDGEDDEARKNLLYASYIAGKSVSKGCNGYVHALSYPLSEHTNIPHGIANAIMLPHVLLAYGNAVHKKLQKLALLIDVADESDSPKLAAQKFILALRKLNRKLGVPDQILGIENNQIIIMARKADEQANPLLPVPAIMHAPQLAIIYYKILGVSKR